MLARTGGLEPRVPQPAPVLLQRQAQVTRLVTRWSEPLADSLAAMNLYLDEPKDRRRVAMDRLVREVGGECRNEGTLLAENALRGSWRMRCRDADLRVTITLAPTEPAKVQYLDVRRIARGEDVASAGVCR
jgi:hypothetical protein